MKTFAMAAAVLGLACTAQPAFAESNHSTTDRMTMTVNLSGIDLSTPEGQATADRRINSAARKVCRVTTTLTGTRIMSQDARACLAKARAGASQQLAAITRNGRRGG